MAPEAPGNLVVIDLRLDKGEPQAHAERVQYDVERIADVEATGEWLLVLWNEKPVGRKSRPVGGGVVYVDKLPRGYSISPRSPASLDILEDNHYAYRHPALGEGLMLVLILPPGHTLGYTKPTPRSAKVFARNRLAVYWKPPGRYGEEAKVVWQLQPFDGDLKTERNRINTEIERAESVPDNPGAYVDRSRARPPATIGQAAMSLVWRQRPAIRYALLALAAIAVIAFGVWNSLPDSVQGDVISWLFRR